MPTKAQENSTIDSLNIIISSTKSNDSKISSYIALADIYSNSDRGVSEEKLLKALSIIKKNTDTRLLGKVYYKLGSIHYKNEKDDIAMSYFLKVDSLFTAHKIINEDLLKTKFLQSQILKFTFTKKGLLDSKKYLDQMLSYATELNDSTLLHWSYQKMGGYYAVLSERENKKQNLDTALIYYTKSKVFFQKNKQFQNLITTLWSVASIQERNGNIEEAKKNHDLRVATLNNIEDSGEKGIVLKSVGDFYTSIGNSKNGIEFLEKASYYFNTYGYPNARDKNELYRDLSKAYYKNGDIIKAYHFKNLELQTLDSINKISNKKQAQELETIYQTEKKEQEIALLQAQNETIEAQKKNQRNLLLGGIGITSLAGIFLFMGYRNRIKTNDKLRELDTAKSDFFANISHEFRTPLSLISGPIEEQLSQSHLEDQERDNLNLAQRSTKRLVILVDQLLDLSKLEAGQFKLKVHKGNLGVFLKSLVSSFQYLAQQNNQSYSTDIEIEDDSHWYDSDALEKIITNLISNALKYSPEQEEIKVNAHISNNALHCTVENSGSPLSKEALTTIFDRFVRADVASAGTGIGLAHTKELVSLHKGTITASSVSNWTSFTFKIPIDKSVYQENEIDKTIKEAPTFGIEQPTTNLTPEEIDFFSIKDKPILLIVDDNADLRTYVGSLFKESHVIHTAVDGQEGYTKALEIVPDIIITDLMMPKDDGITFTKNCKSNEATSHIPVIMLTAKAGDENELLGLETGADNYLTKPFNTAILKTTVKNLQESREKLQQRFSQEVVLLPKDVALNSADERFLNNLQDVMDQNLIESDFNTESFAQALGMSRMQLHRKLKAFTGLSATEFIRSQRLKLAAQMLKKSDINVSQVGYAVGFNNHSYFTKCFKEQYGVSPSDYAKNS